MFTKVLVANRGEIACRVIRALREMGVGSVAVYSDADALALHARLADEAVHVGPAMASKSYLRFDRVIDAAKRTGAEAIHPGYGFLSENADFAEACAAEGLVFIGPSPEAIRVMGNKTDARVRMIDAGVPVVPGSTKPLEDAAEAFKVAKEVGFPILLKAAAGGGGKGMRLVREASELESALGAARREAMGAFSDDRVYVEKAIVGPRHIEIQVLADSFGDAVHVFERECSVQRRHQKVIEESPATNLDREVRDEMGEVAVKGTKAIGYVGAGTFEFLVDKDQRYYFLEMNTRLQVEHPVTELVTDLDLCALQVRVAAGEPLGIRQEDLRQRGHAIECRVYAEDPEMDFAPSPGTLKVYRPPLGPGVRVDDGVREGDQVPVHYDPLVAKMVVFAPTREEAVARADRALGEYLIAGIRHNVDFLRWVLRSEQFRSGAYTTGILEELGAYRAPAPPARARNMLMLAACLADLESAAACAGKGAAPTAPSADPSAWKRAFGPSGGGDLS
jgi:acetyl-CoA carboxylase, biotin carboxylase subunit